MQVKHFALWTNVYSSPADTSNEATSTRGVLKLNELRCCHDSWPGAKPPTFLRQLDLLCIISASPRTAAHFHGQKCDYRLRIVRGPSETVENVVSCDASLRHSLSGQWKQEVETDINSTARKHSHILRYKDRVKPTTIGHILDGWMDGWMDGWVDGWIFLQSINLFESGENPYNNTVQYSTEKHTTQFDQRIFAARAHVAATRANLPSVCSKEIRHSMDV